jgi:hypothetical protein
LAGFLCVGEVREQDNESIGVDFDAAQAALVPDIGGATFGLTKCASGVAVRDNMLVVPPISSAIERFSPIRYEDELSTVLHLLRLASVPKKVVCSRKFLTVRSI